VRPSSNYLKRNVEFCLGSFLNWVSWLDFFSASKGKNFAAENLQILEKESKLLVFFHFSTLRDPMEAEFIHYLQTISEYKILIVAIKEEPKIYKNQVLGGRNLGRDLGSYRDFTTKLLESGFRGKVIYLNNSLYWCPGENFESFIRRLFSSCDPHTVTAVSQSLQRGDHFQTFALGLDFRAEFIGDIFSCVKNVKTKRSLVHTAERRLLQRVIRLGGRVQFLIPYSRLIQHEKIFTSDDSKQIQRFEDLQIPMNPTLHYWAESIALGLPGIKKSLIHKNPIKLAVAPKLKSNLELNNLIRLIISRGGAL